MVIKDKNIWVGLFEVIPQPDSNTLEEGIKGAYVNVGGFAKNEQEFIEKVAVGMEKIDLFVVEYEDVETIAQRKSKEHLAKTILDIRDHIVKESVFDYVVYGSFFTYDSDDT